MREQLKALSEETLVYGASTVIGRFLNFLLVPFYVNVLASSAEYGISTSLYTYMSFFNVIYTMGLEAAYFRYAAKGEQETRSNKEEKELFSSPFLFIVGFGSLLTAAVLYFAPDLVWLAFHDPHKDIGPLTPMLTHILHYGAFIVLFDSIAVLPFAVLRLEHAAKKFASLKLLSIVVTLGLNFFLILVMHMGVEGIFLANLSASFVTLLLLVPTIVHRFEFRYVRSVMSRMAPFGITNVPAYLGAMMVQVIDRPIVQNILGLSILGIYQANYRMGFTMMVFVSLFEYAWRPFFLKESRTNDERARVLFSRIFTYFMSIALLGCLFLAFALPFVVSTKFLGHQLLKKEYLTGMYIIPVVLFAYVFQGMYTNFIAGIYIKEHNKVLPLITGLGAIVNVVANLILIPRIGIMGAALATLLAYVAMAGGIYWQAQKVYYIRYDWRRVGLLFLVVIVAYSIDRIVTLEGFIHAGWPILLFRAGIFLTTILTLYVSGFFSKGEIAFLQEMWSRLLRRKPTVADRIAIEPMEEAAEKQEG